MERFLFLYRGGAPQTKDLSANAVQAHLRKWEAWVAALADDGRFETGEALGQSGKLVSRSGLVVDGPFAESKEAIGGYSIILADDMDDAERIAGQCPIFDYDGTVEIRTLETGMCMDPAET